LKGDLEDYLVVTYDAEQIVGGRFWDRISAGDLHDLKKEARGGQANTLATRLDSLALSRVGAKYEHGV
ncbi:MAG: hypothetical protein PVI61_10310, partial [Methyloceanibacter sp.]